VQKFEAEAVKQPPGRQIQNVPLAQAPEVYDFSNIRKIILAAGIQ
jgi:hypothetical protein